MNIKTLNVFYGEDFLPYKDNAREVHYPNVGSDFQGANEISEIHFYTDRIGDTGSTTFAVAIELPNGKIGSKVIAQSEYDDELHENYVVLPIDDFITRYVGNVTISLRGYQGDITLEYDDESQLYVLSGGTPITAVTGGIKLRVNQVPQGLQGDLDEEVTLQQLLGLVATKLDIDKGIVILGDISTANLSGYEVGQLFYDKNSGTYYEKIATSPYYKKAGDESGVLGSANILCKNGDSALTISELHEIYGNRSYFVYRYLDKDILFNINQVALNDYNCIAFDIENKCFYEKSVVSGSVLPSSILIPSNKVEIASKAFLVSNYVPYNGANADVDLGEHYIKTAGVKIGDIYHTIELVSGDMVLGTGSGDILIQPSEYALYVTSRNDYKATEHEIANIDFVLDHYLPINNDSGVLDETAYNYACRSNATIVFKGKDIFRYAYQNNDYIVYRCVSDYKETNMQGFDTYHAEKALTITKADKSFLVSGYNFDFYNKTQSEGKFATNFTASLDTTTYVLTFTLKNANGNTLATQTIDLPLESIVTSMTYYDTYTYGGTTYHNVLVIVLATTSVPTIVPVGSLISGLEHEALVEVSDISTPLTASQLALLEYPNAMITYGNNVYLKAEDNGTYITLSVPYISLTTNSGHEEATRKFIVVTKSSGAMALTSDTTSFYNKSQTDTLLGEKADASSVVTDSDIETLGGAVTRIRKGNTWNVVAQEFNMSTTPKVVQSVADLPADNDGYLYVVLDNGYLYSWDEENQEWAQQYQYTSDLLTITEVDIDED